MLSRTADHLFWMSRYTERAENTARMLNVSYETSLLPQAADVAQKGWEGLLSISELIPAYTAKHGEVTPANVLEFMVCLLYTSPSPRDQRGSRMPSSA